MKRTFGLSWWVMMYLAAGFAVIYITTWIAASPWATQFVLGYGFQFCLWALFMAALATWMRDRIPETMSDILREQLFFYPAAYVVLGASLFALVFHSGLSTEGTIFLTTTILLGLGFLALAEGFRRGVMR